MAADLPRTGRLASPAAGDRCFLAAPSVLLRAAREPAPTRLIARGGVPSLDVSISNRYMHSPVEVEHLDGLGAVADLLAAVADGATPFAVDV